MDNAQGKKTFNVAHAGSVAPVFPGDGRIRAAAPSMSVNKGYVAPPVYPRYPYDIYAYPGTKHGIEKIFEHTRVPESDNVVTQDLNMRAAKRAYIKEKRAVGGIFVAISAIALIATVAFFVIKYIV